MSVSLSQQCAFQATAFSVLSTVSESIAKALDVELALPNALAICLDGVGLSSGVLYLRGPEGDFRVHTEIGYKNLDRVKLSELAEKYHRSIEAGDLILISPDDLPVDLKSPASVSPMPHGALMAPMISRQKCFGALLLSSDSTPIDSDEWRRFATTVATQIGQAISLSRVVTQLKGSQERYRDLMKFAMDGICLLDKKGTILETNPSLCAIVGKSEADLVGKHFTNLVAPEMLDHVKRSIRELPRAGKITLQGIRLRHPEGRKVFVDLSANLIMMDGKPTVLAVAHDVTERAQAEEQLRQAQKMEAVGLLAGGVAHDFNNILAVILLHCESLLGQPGVTGEQELQSIKKAAERATALTRQLLIFSRKHITETKVVGMNQLLRDLEKLLRRLIGEDVGLELELDPAVQNIRIDPNQFDQIVMNLSLNARDAMPRGGTLKLKTSQITLDKMSGHRRIGVKSGAYFSLEVSDSGCGMDKETLHRIFEPFFTTKVEGKGTGLGLSTVFGIVKHSDADISVESEPQKGTTFKVYFPQYAGVSKSVPTSIQPITHLRGTETILLVEDEPNLREVTLGVLRNSGYHVIAACDGGQALDICAELKGVIDLIVTDVIMPITGGPAFVKKLIESGRITQARVLFLSGYSAGKLFEYGLSEKEMFFLEKPFTRLTLLGKIREILSKLEK